MMFYDLLMPSYAIFQISTLLVAVWAEIRERRSRDPHLQRDFTGTSWDVYTLHISEKILKKEIFKSFLTHSPNSIAD